MEKKKEKLGTEKKEKTDENSGHYIIANSRLPERQPLERRTLVPKLRQPKMHYKHILNAVVTYLNNAVITYLNNSVLKHLNNITLTIQCSTISKQFSTNKSEQCITNTSEECNTNNSE